MPSRPNKYDKRSNSSKAEVDRMLKMMFTQAQAQFGDAVKAFWFYDGDLCPGCLEHPIGAMKFKGQDALSLNAFLHRTPGVLIGYFLCEVCANFIFKEAQKNPYRPTSLHIEIEQNLRDAYDRYLASMDA